MLVARAKGLLRNRNCRIVIWMRWVRSDSEAFGRISWYGSHSVATAAKNPGLVSHQALGEGALSQLRPIGFLSMSKNDH